VTAIVRLTIENKYPILIGDILLSGRNTGKVTLNVPTVPNIHDLFPARSKFIPCSLHQKIAVLSDDFVIGWSGNYLNAKEVIRDLVGENKAEPLTKTSLNAFFQQLPPSIWEKDLGFLGFVRDSNGIAPFNYKAHMREYPNFGQVGFLGTGGEALENLLDQFSVLPKARHGEPTGFQKSLAFASGIVGSLLTMELVNAQSLRDYFGAWYEIASLIEGKFQKLGGIVFLFWIVDQADNQITVSSVPLHALSLDYSNDVLILHSVSFDTNTVNKSSQQSVFFITPMTRLVSDEELRAIKPPDLNQKLLCNFFWIRSGSEFQEIYARVDHRSEINRGIIFHEENNHIIVSVQKEFIQEAAEAIMKKAT